MTEFIEDFSYEISGFPWLFPCIIVISVGNCSTLNVFICSQKLVPTEVKQIWSKDGIVGDTGYTSMEKKLVMEHVVETFTEEV